MTPPRILRLRDELAEVGLDVDPGDEWGSLLLSELDYALRPRVHERRVPSVGAIIQPSTPPVTWEQVTGLRVTLRRVDSMPLTGARLFADGISSWLVRTADGADEWAVFDRPAGSERDLVVMAEAMGATVVQRHPNGSVRVSGTFGVLRWEGLTWKREPPVSDWIDTLIALTTDPAIGDPYVDRDVLETLLEFAVHDLGARGVGALLVLGGDRDANGDADPDGSAGAGSFQLRLPQPPALDVRQPADLAPLRHALGQTDGAAVIDRDGILRQLGVRLIPSAHAEGTVDALRGMRHTSARRYSFDDPLATVIVVSEDGPVTVLRHGEVLGTSPPRGGGISP